MLRLSKYRTPLADLHSELGGNLGDFSGWLMPIDYGDMLGEAVETRRSATVFDVSHLVKIKVEGRDSTVLLQRLVAKDISKLRVGTILSPTAFLNERGGFVDDVAVYRLGEEYLIVGNAANWEKDVKWLQRHTRDLEVSIRDLTTEYAMLAVQGPKALEFVSKIVNSVGRLGKLEFLREPVDGVLVLSRSGWTGEDGCEVIAKPEVAADLFRKLVKEGVKPAGLGARDILRIEMGYCLYGHEIDEETNPIEARYWVFSWRKRDYIGSDALLKVLEKGVRRVRIGLTSKKRVPIPRQGSPLYSGSSPVGYVTSGTFSPNLKRIVALGYVKPSHAVTGLRLEVEIRSRRYPLRITEIPFYKAG